MSRKPVIAGNWKMNKTAAETRALIAEIIPLVRDARAEVAVCVPFTDLAAAVEAAKGTNIGVGAQNVHWAEKGAFTGEISAAMLVEAGAEYVVIGHSERRQYFGETDDTVNQRLKAALAAGLKPIVCVGERLEERESGHTAEVVIRQTKGAFRDIDGSEIKNIILAYEPVWAIGTGRTATPEDANETIKVIRDTMADLYGRDAAENALRIQYGGSMKPSNVDDLMAMPEIDGGLIGGASLKAPDFARIVNYEVRK